MSTTKRAGVAAFEDTLRDFWATRPVRPRFGGKVGGVSAAIGLRYGIDPILVRVAFVLAAIYGGAGVVLYLLGWLLFPKEGDPVPGGPKPKPEPTSSTLAVILVLLLIPSVFWLTSSPSIIGLAVGLGAFYLVHRTYGDRNVAPPAAAPTTTPVPDATPAGENTWVYPGAESTSKTEQQTPPAWDPLGAAPFAWDLPEPGEPEPPEPKRPPRRWITWVTLVLAAFAGGLTGSLGAPLYVSLAIALGVLGVGMLLGSFLRGGRGLIVAAVPLAAVAMLASALPASTFGGSVGDQQIRPAALSGLAPDYQLSAGTVTLDLRDMQIADGESASSATSVGVGDIVVRLPRDVDATVRCKAELGDVQCLNQTSSGGTADQTTTDLGPDGPGGGQLTLDLRVGVGSVEVTRD
ncbi:PspC domain-containing protein [Saccharopolyspora hirsuta]|uniref:PspC domain-containing protein n=1 Tax=Saccharopolyspora hirsuta TaxID=1837 RepID=A0A5M7C1X0_SACHI|nr:PspC domain-containing protein [Saccharopolyspora hirsuta]KAA5833524.1 PspC domain-containing protein [Saccharopolyspora hirsuta]MBF6507786.1 PspC domain-containing protein [Nocardia farcinica]